MGALPKRGRRHKLSFTKLNLLARAQGWADIAEIFDEASFLPQSILHNVKVRVNWLFESTR